MKCFRINVKGILFPLKKWWLLLLLLICSGTINAEVKMEVPLDFNQMLNEEGFCICIFMYLYRYKYVRTSYTNVPLYTHLCTCAHTRIYGYADVFYLHLSMSLRKEWFVTQIISKFQWLNLSGGTSEAMSQGPRPAISSVP